MKAEDVQIETFSGGMNYWAIRVIHRPTGLVAERSSDGGRSRLKAREECIAELDARLGNESSSEPVREAMAQAMRAASGGWFAEHVNTDELASIAYNTLCLIRYQAFKEGNDKVWGEGNWVSCNRCLDAVGLPSFHHRDHHSTESFLAAGPQR